GEELPAGPGVGGDLFVLQTSRRVIRCHQSDEPDQDTDHRRVAVHATWGILDALSMRQLQVLRLVTRGYSNDRIGATIGRTKRAIEWHIRGLFSRLKVIDRVQLTIAGMRAGLDDIPEQAWKKMLALRFGIDHERRPSDTLQP
nr:helix-turn-helix transcriptional regulator [Phycisphaerales bacterium]